MISIVKLSNVVSIHKGSKVDNIYYEEKSNWKRYIQIDDLRNNDNLKYTDSNLGTEVNKNDVIIAWDGANAGTIGYGLDGIIGSTLARLRINNDKILAAYLGKLLQSKFSFLRSACTGATIPHISRNVLENINIQVLPLETQKQIISQIDRADELRQKRKKAITLLDNYLRSVFYNMFGDPMKNEKGWEVEELGNICSIRRGASPRPINEYLGGTIPWIKIGDGTKGNEIYIEKTSVFVTEEGAEKSVRLKVGSLIFANCGVSLGFARILKISGCIHDGWLAFEDIDSKVNNIYLLKLINTITYYLRSLAPEGTQPNLNTRIMKGLDIILPPIEQQNKFAGIVEQVEKTKAKMKVSLKEMDNLFNSLMQKAFKV